MIKGLKRKKNLFVIISILLGIAFFLFSFSQSVQASSDGSSGDYCCRFQCCNGTWIAVNCQSSCCASCSGVDKEWWCYYNDGYSDCPADCTGCSCSSTLTCGSSYPIATNNGCASYTYSCTKRDSCGDSCGTEYKTCYRRKYSVNFYAGSNGYISGTASQNICYGANSAYVTAVANSGYQFSHWSDSNTNATRRVTSVTSNISRTAYFSVESYTVNFYSGANGYISGTTTQNVPYNGTTSSVTAVPNTGYNFSHWSDGVSSATRTVSNVTSNVSVTAYFTPKIYRVDFYSTIGGYISGDTTQYVPHGGNTTSVTAIPDSAHDFGSWSDGLTDATRHVANVTSNTSRTAHFSIKTYTVSFTTSPGGYISGPAYQVVEHGADSANVTAVANTGSYFTHWSDSVSVATRNVTNVKEDTHVHAYFDPYIYEVNYNANGGSCSPTSVNVLYGQSAGPPTCSRSGYLLTGFTKVFGTCGSLNTSTGYVGNVTCPLTIGANWCDNSVCDPLATLTCPVDTSPTGTYGYYSTLACVNDCGQVYEEDCYCDERCTLGPCPDGTSESNPDGDKVEYTAEPIFCSNKCSDVRVKACYCDKASCTDLASEVEWLDECPDGSCRSVEKTVPIPSPADSCPTEEIKTCYYDNDRPEVPDIGNPDNGLDVDINLSRTVASNEIDNTSLLQRIVKSVRAQVDGQETELQYYSDTHTGQRLNNPLRVTAEFSDANGISDLQALSLWWSTSDTKTFTTPNQLGDSLLGGKTENNENFGFMITRHINGNWENLYRPYIDGGTTQWVQESSPTADSITILGPNEENMVQISEVDISYNDANTLTLEFDIEFLWEGSSDEKVANANYNIWATANDTAGFLPFGDTEVIQESQDVYWRNSGTTWNVDLEDPVETSPLAISHTTDTEIVVNFGVRDNENHLAKVRLDACRTAAGDADVLTVDSGDYTLVNCDDVGWGSFTPTDLNMNAGNNLLGVNPIDPMAQDYAILDSSLTVNLNGNESGSLSFYLTFMDEAGNWSQLVETLRLGEWVASKGGFVYGADGVSSATRPLETDWDNNPLIKSEYGFEYGRIDLTDQILLGGNSSTSSFLGELVRYGVSENSSFKVSNFSGVFVNSPYTELISILEDRIEEGEITNYGQLLTVPSPLSGNILDQTECVANDYCILRREGDLEVSSGSTCGGNGLVAVNGNLTINPDFKNVNDADRCIFVVSGNVNIAQGTDPNTNPKVDYDVIEAYIVSAGQIIIEGDPFSNGLIVQGGLSAFNSGGASSSIINQRTIELDYRNMHPVLAVDANPKYGLLSRTLFGSQTDIFRVDIGFKPY